MAATAIGVVPVATAFFAAACAMVLTGALPLRDVYGQIDAPILIMLACLIPVSESLQSTGGTEIIAHGLSLVASALPGWAALALIMVAAMAVTPFLNNAATVLVMAPIAAVFATGLGYQPEAFLMAVASGRAATSSRPSDTSATRWSWCRAATGSATTGGWACRSPSSSSSSPYPC